MNALYMGMHFLKSHKVINICFCFDLIFDRRFLKIYDPHIFFTMFRFNVGISLILSKVLVFHDVACSKINYRLQKYFIFYLYFVWSGLEIFVIVLNIIIRLIIVIIIIIIIIK